MTEPEIVEVVRSAEDESENVIDDRGTARSVIDEERDRDSTHDTLETVKRCDLGPADRGPSPPAATVEPLPTPDRTSRPRLRSEGHDLRSTLPARHEPRLVASVVVGPTRPRAPPLPEPRRDERDPAPVTRRRRWILGSEERGPEAGGPGQSSAPVRTVEPRPAVPSRRRELPPAPSTRRREIRGRYPSYLARHGWQGYPNTPPRSDFRARNSVHCSRAAPFDPGAGLGRGATPPLPRSPAGSIASPRARARPRARSAAVLRW